VANYLRRHPLNGGVYVLAIGKAACHMAQGAYEVMGNQIKQGLVITRHGYTDSSLPEFITVLEAGHPIPDFDSLKAGRALRDFVQRIPNKSHLLCLISGGASSLVEVVPESVSLDQLQALNRWLLGSGLPIVTMNVLRQQISCIKAGRLLQDLPPCHITALLISDVEGDDPSIIGSGLLFAPRRHITIPDRPDMPYELQDMLAKNTVAPLPDSGANRLLSWKIIANSQLALQAAFQAALKCGYQAVIHPEFLHGDAIQTGQRIASLIQSQSGVVHIWGGETTLTLPTVPGIGGRCLSLALSAAIDLHEQLQRTKRNWCLLAAGTDGQDGVSNAAGVCINKQSFEELLHSTTSEWEPTCYLQRADAATFFKPGTNLLITGPTGTNVNDVVLAYCDPG